MFVVVEGFFDGVWSYIKAALERDPAARHFLEVLFCYPGVQALIAHRVVHFFWRIGLRSFARFMSNIVRFFTGVEIHPAARIGEAVFIDHGMGVVIGETAEVGDGTTIFQGVTLGGTGKEHGKRHPTIGRNVVIGAGAILLGPIRVGDNVRVGAGSVVLQDVEEGATVVGVPARVARRNGESVRLRPLDHRDISDPLLNRIAQLERQIENLTLLLSARQGGD